MLRGRGRGRGGRRRRRRNNFETSSTTTTKMISMTKLSYGLSLLLIVSFLNPFFFSFYISFNEKSSTINNDFNEIDKQFYGALDDCIRKVKKRRINLQQRQKECENLQQEQQRYQQRHYQSHNKNNKKKNNDNENENNQNKIILFVHFHKAGGTSIVNKFRYEGGYRTWTPSTNGNPQQANNKKAVLQFWQYNRTQFENFLLDSQSKKMNQLRKYDLEQNDGMRVPDLDDDDINNDNDNESGGTTSSGGVEFLAMEWNFFQHDHFFKQPNNNYLQQEANIEVITIIRDPYERFISNFLFQPDNKGRLRPFLWAQKDYKYRNFVGVEVPHKKQKRQHVTQDDLDKLETKFQRDKFNEAVAERLNSNIIQYGKVITNADFRVNYNKPNYYTAYLNGLAQNDDDNDGDGNGDENNDNDNKNEYGYNYSFDYFAFGLNRTHLEIAKERLRDMFDVILILERPETHQQLSKWFAFTTEDSTNTNTTTTTNTTDPNPSYALLIVNSATGLSMKQQAKLLFTEEKFYKYNALDKELYEYAIELSLSKQQQQQQQQQDL